MKAMFLLLILLFCTITDIKERRIYNEILLIGIILALILNLHESRTTGLLEMIKGMAIGTSVFFIPYLLGWLGAGDAKLTGIIGAFEGWRFVLYCTLSIAVAGGLISVFLLIRDRKTGSLFQNLHMLFLTKSPHYLHDKEQQHTFPYAAAILIGTGITLVLQVIGYV